MSEQLRRTWAEIHLDHLQQNVQAIRRRLAPDCRMMAMVKANGYGHGAVSAAQAMSRDGVDWFGVSNLEEAIELRRGGIDRPILIVSYTPPCQAAQLAEYGVTQAVVSRDHGERLNEAAAAAGVRLSVHIKVDTGMSRVGFVCQDEDEVPSAAADIAVVCQLPHLDAEGIFTHFARADEQQDDGFTARQFSLFTAVMDELRDRGITFSLRHCCNSAATVRFSEYHLDMVRPGILLYGLLPDGWMRDVCSDFRPVMEMKTTVSEVKELSADRYVSYNGIYRTDKRTRLATVPIGYGDGYSRRLSDRGYMLIKGQKVPVVGRVCMDQCMLDVTDLPQVREGDTVTVFGTDGGTFLPVDTLAELCDTIHYEVVCLVTKRVPRMYID